MLLIKSSTLSNRNTRASNHLSILLKVAIGTLDGLHLGRVLGNLPSPFSIPTVLAAPSKLNPRVEIPNVRITLVSDTLAHQESVPADANWYSLSENLDHINFIGLWISGIEPANERDSASIVCTTKHNKDIKSKEIGVGGQDAFTPVIPVYGLCCYYKNTLFRKC